MEYSPYSNGLRHYICTFYTRLSSSVLVFIKLLVPYLSKLSISFPAGKMSELFGKLETEVEINAPAAKYHELFTRRPHHLSNIKPDKIQSCDLLEGQWGHLGSVISWNYCYGMYLPKSLINNFTLNLAII